MQASFHQFLHNYRGLSQERNFAETRLLATVGNRLANTSEKNLRNNGVSGCGWLY